MREMKTPVLIVAALLILAGGGVYFFAIAPRRQLEATRREHREELERSMAPYTAMMKAPLGSTPCETSYNSFHAFNDVAVAQSHAVPWRELPDRDTFLKRCATLTEQEQQCLDTRFNTVNHPLCDPLVASVMNRNVLFEKVR
jgi:hypothetical protein